jgi:hypothetical protein
MADKRTPEEVIQVAIDEALKEASPFYEGMARPYIPLLQGKVSQALHQEGWVIVDGDIWAKIKMADQK